MPGEDRGDLSLATEVICCKADAEPLPDQDAVSRFTYDRSYAATYEAVENLPALSRRHAAWMADKIVDSMIEALRRDPALPLSPLRRVVACARRSAP